MGYGFKVIAEGPYACFSRPEMKEHRISYDVPTPGALEGMLKSIYWKPAIRYVIDQIVVFNAIRFQNVRSTTSPQREAGDGEERHNALADCGERVAMALRNVRYGIAFHFELTGRHDDDPNPSKQYNMILRRLRKGQCFRQPCFGLSDYPVTQLDLVEHFNLDEISPEIRAQGDVDLGQMLYGLQFKEEGEASAQDKSRSIFPDMATAVYYNPHMIDGVIDVQKYKDA